MRLHILLPAVLIGLSAGQAAWADLTIRYKMTFRAGSGMPPQVAKSLEDATRNIPTELVSQIQGDKVRSELPLGKTVLVDYGQRQMTILDIPGQRFATAPIGDFPKAQPGVSASIPAQVAEALRNLRFDVQNRDTGRLTTINGMRAEESATVITVSIPVSQGQPFKMQIDIGVFRPLEDEINRLPALQEYAAWSTRATASVNPADMLNGLFGEMPGLGEQMRTAIESLYKASSRPPLRINAALSVPGLMDLMRQQSPQGNGLPPGLDISGNLLEMNFELVELSATPLLPELFSVPPNLRSVSTADIMNPLPAAAPKPLPEGEIFRVGGGVSVPKLVSKVEPKYSEEARRDRLEGTVVLSVVVGSDGVAHNVHVMQSLRPDLDQKAIEAVLQWRFSPGLKDGKPVNEFATIEVNFRLRHDPPAQEK
jgi:TonB family protein